MNTLLNDLWNKLWNNPRNDLPGRTCILMGALCIVLALQSCADNATESMAEPTMAAQRWAELLSRDMSEFPAPATPQLPKDLGTHAQVRAESFMLQAVLHMADENSSPKPEAIAGLLARIDRVALRPQPNEQTADSAWRYGSIMRSTSFVDTSLSDPTQINTDNADDVPLEQFTGLSDVAPRQTVQRMALGLAGSTDDELWVGSDRLTITRSDRSSQQCDRSYRWEVTLSAAQSIMLDVQIQDCPTIQALGEFNSWGQSSMVLSGFLMTNQPGAGQISTAVEGAAWMRHSWGNFPSGGGAVAIDSLQIRLDDSRWLDVSRSKRRSGRGPRTVSATLRVADSVAEDIELTWDDSDSTVIADSGNAYPQSIQLRSSDQELSLTVNVMNRLAESSDFAGSRLQTPVIVSGTHAGQGFLSFNALAN